VRAPGGIRIGCDGIGVSYGEGEGRTAPLVGTALAVPAGESVAIIGPSGSGKSTLLRILAGIQRPDEGEVTLDGVAVTSTATARRHRQRVSVVHQDYRLVPFLTAAENVRLALELTGHGRAAADAAAAKALKAVGLHGYEGRLPDTLSGGEQQRVAIARALAGQPAVMLADEPTGALDQENSEAIALLLSGLASRHGLAVVIATHDAGVARRMSRRMELRMGSLHECEP
jgi:putative ABC transport system ATP-binding protein